MILYSISFMVLVLGCSRKILQVSGFVILAETYKGIILEKEKLDYLPVEIEHYQTWVPNENDIKKTEQILSGFIQKDSLLSMPLSKYTRQYFGIIENSEKVIYINGFYWEECNLLKEEWKTNFIEFEDGGDLCFQVKVGLDKKKCYEFSINSYA